MQLTVTTRKSTKRESLLAIASFFARELKIARNNFELVIMTCSNLRAETGAEGVTYRDLTKPATIVVRVDSSLRIMALITVLAHEMIHVKQHVRGHLKYDARNRPWWKGVLHSNVSYADSPWEVEAYRDMVKLIERMFIQINA